MVLSTCGRRTARDIQLVKAGQLHGSARPSGFVDRFHDRVILDPFLAWRMRLAVLGDALGKVV